MVSVEVPSAFLVVLVTVPSAFLVNTTVVPFTFLAVTMVEPSVFLVISDLVKPLAVLPFSVVVVVPSSAVLVTV